MKLLDLFCGAGGAAMGYSRAGFDEIVGVDNRPQPRYPFTFVQADALEYIAEHGHKFDAIHASPPCQAYSIMNNLPWNRHRGYPLLILPTREALDALGKPYAIENVLGARYGAKGLEKRGLGAHGMQAGWLCGGMFGLPFYRHRLFETNWFWMQPGHPKHRLNLHPRAERFLYGGQVKGLPGGAAGLDVKSSYNPVNTAWREYHDGTIPLRQYTRANGKVETGTRTGTTEPGYGLTQWQQNGIQKGIGHAKGWRLDAEAMGIDWMKREELTQAIPPVYTEFIGKWMLAVIEAQPWSA